MFLTLLVQTLLLPGAPMPAQYVEVQRNWRVDESGSPLLSTERRKAFAVEVVNGVRRKRNLESGAILEEVVGVSQGFSQLLGTHELRVETHGDCLLLVAEGREGATRRHEFVFDGSGLVRHTAELVAAEKGLGAGSKIVTRYGEGRLTEIEVEFSTEVAGAPYRGLQRTSFQRNDTIKSGA